MRAVHRKAVEREPMETATDPQTAEKHLVEQIFSGRARIQAELARVIVGQKEVIEQLLIALFAGGHCLITGAPGLAKTLLVKSLSQIFHLRFQRIQFTPDLMPADITGTEILQESAGGRTMTFVPGPVFANMILADEINRTPPKTQAALLEAMQEHQVTAAGVRHPLQEPFFVLATQNPRVSSCLLVACSIHFSGINCLPGGWMRQAAIECSSVRRSNAAGESKTGQRHHSG